MTAEDTDTLDVAEDVLLDGRVRLVQPRRGHRAGTDAVLLAGLAEVRAGDRVLDLGSASGAVGLMVAAREPSVRVTLVEREVALAELARRNLLLNGLAERGRAVAADIFAPAAELREAGVEAGAADLVVSNPPFFADRTRASPDPARRAAHAMAGGDLQAWLARAAWCLGPRGRLLLIHRADSLVACLDALRPAFGSLAITAVHPRDGADAIRILVGAVKGGRAPLRMNPALVLHRPDGSFTPAADALHRGGRLAEVRA